MNRLFLLLFISLFLLNCQNSKKQETAENTNHIEELFGLMQGSYDSEVQSQVDSTYYNISLHMIPIWKDKGHFLYVEQALNDTQDQPYRQRIYEVTQVNDSLYKSDIYTLPNDSLWIGKWKTPNAFNSISIKDISHKDGCEVLLKREEPNYYMGKTGDDSCESTMRGASFARSEVEIMEDKIISWDRGFDSNGDHVWGAEKGGYIFNKLD